MNMIIALHIKLEYTLTLLKYSMPRKMQRGIRIMLGNLLLVETQTLMINMRMIRSPNHPPEPYSNSVKTSVILLIVSTL